MACKEYGIENKENIYTLKDQFRLKFGNPLTTTFSIGSSRLKPINFSYYLYSIDDCAVLLRASETNETNRDKDRIFIIGIEYKINETKANLESRLKMKLNETK